MMQKKYPRGTVPLGYFFLLLLRKNGKMFLIICIFLFVVWGHMGGSVMGNSLISYSKLALSLASDYDSVFVINPTDDSYNEYTAVSIRILKRNVRNRYILRIRSTFLICLRRRLFRSSLRTANHLP